MRFKKLCSLFVLLPIVLPVLSGCHCECDPCHESTAPAQSTAAAPTIVTTPVRVEPVAPAAPQVAGKWIGTWESIGHKGHGGGLKCEATEAGPGKWTAVFTAEYGPTKSYNVNLEGKLGSDVVLFGGKVDLGKGDGGIFTWTGEATATAFKGKYEGGGDTGSFQMVRAPH